MANGDTTSGEPIGVPATPGYALPPVPTAAVVPPTPGISSSPPTEAKKSDFLGDIAKVTAIIGFFLYATGFLIWRAYLSSFGISAVGFLKAEYLASALCYLVVLIFVGLPVGLLVAKTIRRIKKEAESETSNPLRLLLLFWAFSTLQLSIQLPFVQLSIASRIVQVVMVIGVFVLLGAVVLAVRTQNQKLKVHLEELIWAPILLALSGISILLSSIDFTFFCVTVFYCALMGGYSLQWHKSFWKGLSPSYKIFVIAFFSWMLMLDIQIFGKNMFGQIPQSIGGGKPEKVLLRFSPTKQELGSLLEIPAITNSSGSHVFFGPVSILVRSDNEIFFVLPDELTRTKSTNILEKHSTNIVNLSSTNSVTNIVQTMETNIIKFTPRARQMRADLVDAIIYVPDEEKKKE